MSDHLKPMGGTLFAVVIYQGPNQPMHINPKQLETLLAEIISKRFACSVMYVDHEQQTKVVPNA